MTICELLNAGCKMCEICGICEKLKLNLLLLALICLKSHLKEYEGS